MPTPASTACMKGQGTRGRLLGACPSPLLRRARGHEIAGSRGKRWYGSGSSTRSRPTSTASHHSCAEAERQSRAGPILDELRQWLHDILWRTSKKSALGKAAGYVLSRWTAFTRYRDDGQIEIDNNAAERALRAVALGRKNYLFCGSDAGGERAAAVYSLVGTAKLNGLDPQAYLRYVIERIADQPSNRVHELLPWAVADAIAAFRPHIH